MSKPKVLCPVPFTSLILNPDGIVGCCREKGTKHEIGNIKNETIEEIWNGEKLKSWRREFLTGNITTCKKEIEDSSCHLIEWNQDLHKHTQYSEVINGPILRLSPDINGNCNLKCPFCDVWQLPNGLYDSIEGFWEHLKTHILKDLLQIDPLAGEPFTQKDFYKIIKLAHEVNPHCEWDFTSNGQWHFSSYIKDHLDLLKIRQFSISLDSANTETYSKIRSPGDLNTTIKTILALKDYRDQRIKENRGFRLILNFSLQQSNIYEIKDILDFCNKLELYPFIQFVYVPSELSTLSLEEGERVNILQWYIKNLTPEQLMISHRVLRPLLKSIENTKLKAKLLKTLELLTEGKFKEFLFKL
ncbi:SPASM domain-containing protein [Halobacteriovorax sp. HLS]|uniref:SPASM domain-containing protein n=1 Tax=Halobacteriovorax sp. HLS TaxID=2234000 RepID=UPI0013E38FC4|nr:SPASM domain-containing protein [Halobacteriovorax sp. HLS]